MYLAVVEYQERLGNTFNSVYKNDQTKAAADLTAAAAEIDGYLTSRYQVPVTTPEAQELLKDWNYTLALPRTYDRAGGSTIPDKVEKQVKHVRQLLRDAAEGKFKLPGETAEAENAVGGALIVQCEEPQFTRDKLAGY